MIDTLLEWLRGNLSPTARVLTAAGPAVLLLAVVFGGMGVFAVRNLVREPYHDADVERRGSTPILNMWLRRYFSWLMPMDTLRHVRRWAETWEAWDGRIAGGASHVNTPNGGGRPWRSLESSRDEPDRLCGPPAENYGYHFRRSSARSQLAGAQNAVKIDYRDKL